MALPRPSRFPSHQTWYLVIVLVLFRYYIHIGIVFEPPELTFYISCIEWVAFMVLSPSLFFSFFFSVVVFVCLCSCLVLPLIIVCRHRTKCHPESSSWYSDHRWALSRFSGARVRLLYCFNLCTSAWRSVE